MAAAQQLQQREPVVEDMQEGDMPEPSFPWHIALALVWPLLDKASQLAVSEVCQDSLYEVRRLCSKLNVSVSLAYGALLSKKRAKLIGQGEADRFKFVEDVTLTVDADHMEDMDEINTPEQRLSCALHFLTAHMGAAPSVKTITLNCWDSMPLEASHYLIANLPQLQSLTVLYAYRLDLAYVQPTHFKQLHRLSLHSYTINVTPEDVAALPALAPTLRELRLEGLQLNDQKTDSALCAALGALTNLTHLNLVSFSAAAPASRVLLTTTKDTLRTNPWARLGPALACLEKLEHLHVSDQSFTAKACNFLLSCLTALPSLSHLHIPEARVREEGWNALQALTQVTNLHVYSIELKGQTRAQAAGRMTWWKRLRLEDTCLPELATFMPIPGLEVFIGTIFLRYGEGPVPPRDFRGWDKVQACLSLCQEVRLWLEVDCDVWAGLSVALGGLPNLKEVVVRTRAPHILTEADLATLVSHAPSLQYVDIFGANISDGGLAPLHGLQQLTKVCLGLTETEERVGHTEQGVRDLAVVMQRRGKASRIIAPSLFDEQVAELDAWLEETYCPAESVGGCCVTVSNQATDYFSHMDL